MAEEPHGQRRKARLFFALWPDDSVRRRVAVHRQAVGRPVAPENWHITLVFLGAVGPERQRILESAADEIRLPSFQLNLDRIGHWARSSVTWLGSGRPPPTLLRLQRRLWEVAQGYGSAADTKQYEPHLTLARDAPSRAARPIEPIQWNVADFCLVDSVTYASGARYSVRRRWPLQAAPG